MVSRIFPLPTGFTRDSRHLTLTHTALDEQSRAVPTGVTSLQRTDLVVTALGHHADPLQAYYDSALGHLRTDRGRVLDASGRALRRVYASGWAATGARGVLAATMIDAYAVADAILADYTGGSDASAVPVPQDGACSDDVLVSDDVDPGSVPGQVERGMVEGRVVQYDQWKKIDAEEVRRGDETGKERERKGWGGKKHTSF
jgi:adrenodoxin-NADP+ reductase